MKKTLDQFIPGECGYVEKINGIGAIKRRLIDLGVTPGSRIAVQKYAPLGDPIEIKIKNYNLSLRKSEAAMIEMEAEEA